MHEITMLEETCDMLNRELERANAKLAKAGDMSASDLDYIDKLTHAIKSVKTTLAMLESEGYSNGYPYMYSREDGDHSYARMRDARGRYTSRGRGDMQGYSYANDKMISELRELMHEAKDDSTREEFKHFIKRLESL